MPRRTEILLCIPGEPVQLVREPKNPADPNAIAVHSARGIQIGYLKADRAPLIGAYMHRHEVIAIFQRPEPWGATIRAAFDEAPVLPPERPKPDSEPDWWPDEEWPDE